MMMQMQHMQMQQMRQNVPRFGPNSENYNPIFSTIAAFKFQSMEFFVDENYNIVNQTSETEYPDFERDKILEEYQEDNKIKFFTTVFFKNQHRNIYQNKDTKEIIIDYKTIN
jgi:hypothetical protein